MELIIPKVCESECCKVSQVTELSISPKKVREHWRDLDHREPTLNIVCPLRLFEKAFRLVPRGTSSGGMAPDKVNFDRLWDDALRPRPGRTDDLEPYLAA